MFGLRLRGQWLVPIILGIASPGSACPVCGVGRDGTASVYLITAVLMCIVPLMMFGGVAYYLSPAHQARSTPASRAAIS